MAIIRKVRNERSVSLFTQVGNVELPPSVVVDMYEKLTDDKLLDIQLELQILKDNGAITVIEEDEESELKAGGIATQTGDLTINGTIIGVKDNGTAFRVKGLQHTSEGSAQVQSYTGIFNNDGYDGIGTLKTRVIMGANVEMDYSLQSPHALILAAVDGTQTDGVIRAFSQNGIEFHARADAEVLSPKRLIIDRTVTGSTGAANTSDINLKANSGSIYINSGVTDGAVVLPKLTAAQRDALTGVAGMTVYNTDTNKLNFYNGSAWEAVTSA